MGRFGEGLDMNDNTNNFAVVAVDLMLPALAKENSHSTNRVNLELILVRQHKSTV